MFKYSTKNTNLKRLLDTKLFAALVTVLLLLFVFTKNTNAQNIPDIPDISACQIPLTVEHLEDHTSVVGFDDNLPYLLMYTGGGGGEFSLEGLSAVTPWFLPMSDQMYGDMHFPPPGVITVDPIKPPQVLRMYYPYGQGLQLEPNHDRTEWRDYRTPDQEWTDFIFSTVFETDHNIDGIVGHKPTNLKPLFWGCLQRLVDPQGVKFPMYPNTSEEYPSNQESASIDVTSIGALANTLRIVPPLEGEADTMFRHLQSPIREIPEKPEQYEPEVANCFDCPSWAGGACQAPNYKVIWPVGLCESGKCDDDAKAATNVNLVSAPPDNIYVLFTYAITQVPYTKYRAGTTGDFRFARALAKVPGVPAIEDKFVPTDHISKSAYYLQNTGGFTPINPVNYPNKIYKEYQSDASSWCTLQKSLSLKCDPSTPNFTGCWDYLGADNQISQPMLEPPADVSFPDGDAPAGIIPKWCEVAWRGTDNIIPPAL